MGAAASSSNRRSRESGSPALPSSHLSKDKLDSRFRGNDGKRMNASLCPRVLEAVAEAADGGDDVGAELLADAGDEHLDGVRIAVEILIVNMLDQLGAADHLALVVHQIRKQFIFLRGQLDRLAVESDLARAGIETDVAGGQFGRGVARGAADEGAQAGDQLLGLERLGEIIVGAGGGAGGPVPPAVARGA